MGHGRDSQASVPAAEKKMSSLRRISREEVAKHNRLGRTPATSDMWLVNNNKVCVQLLFHLDCYVFVYTVAHRVNVCSTPPSLPIFVPRRCTTLPIGHSSTRVEFV
jgi:hypothetical protein